jgi:hypothetical protein
VDFAIMSTPPAEVVLDSERLLRIGTVDFDTAASDDAV